ncbi:MAG: thymidine phosphorylase [bacterium]|nr:thymidine phosphorylase [bacterium]
MRRNQTLATDAIRKKLIGKALNYQEIFALMDEIGNRKLGPVLTAYFAAAGFQHGFSSEELYYLTKAMAETGKKLHFKGVVADKHSTGGVSGTRTTMILVPIIAAAGIKIPKTSSRAITTPSGTADTMEVLSPVNFTARQMEKIVNKVGGCIVWGGHLGMAPADDVIIQVEQPLAFESFDKIIVSVMAKKIAAGANHVVIDIPVGSTMKIVHFKDAEIIAKKFTFLAKKFKMKIAVDVNETREPAGRGIGPVLETRDVLAVLEQKNNRPLALEQKTLRLAGRLLDLCFQDIRGKQKLDGFEVAREILQSGKALSKMREIVSAQGGKPDFSSEKMLPGKEKFHLKAKKKGRVNGIDAHQISVIGRILGCPGDKRAGLYLEKRVEEQVDKDDILLTIYSSDRWRLNEAKETLENLPVYQLGS